MVAEKSAQRRLLTNPHPTHLQLGGLERRPHPAQGPWGGAAAGTIARSGQGGRCEREEQHRHSGRGAHHAHGDKGARAAQRHGLEKEAILGDEKARDSRSWRTATRLGAMIRSAATPDHLIELSGHARRGCRAHASAPRPR